jgi:hypothetical protein
MFFPYLMALYVCPSNDSRLVSVSYQSPFLADLSIAVHSQPRVLVNFLNIAIYRELA